MGPGFYYWKLVFSRSNNPLLREIAETVILTKTWDEFDNLTKHGLLSSGTHTMLNSYLWGAEFEWGREYNHGRGFYRGESLEIIYPYAGYFTSKNWYLNEEFKNLKDNF